jgi:type IV secretory pathway VirJ component
VGIGSGGCAVAHPTPVPAELKPLPLMEQPAVSPGGHTLVLLMSGDGDWSAMMRGLSTALAKAGYAVIGLNARSYMASAPTPERNAQDAVRILRYYMRQWDRDTIVIAGYSRGADWAPVVAARLPADLRQRLRLVAMLSPGHDAEYLLFDWFGLIPTRTVPLLPVIDGLRGVPMLCVYGVGDAKNSVCPRLPDGVATVVARPGGHRANDPEDQLRPLLAALAMP